MTKTYVSHVTYRDGSVEEIRGYEGSRISDGMVFYYWGTSTVAIPIDTIKIIASEENEQ